MSGRDGGSSLSFFWRFAILALALFMNATLAVRLMWGDQSVGEWRNLKGLQNALFAELSGLDKRRAELSLEIRLLQTDPAYTEKIIRQRLNYERNDEILYLFDDAGEENSPWTGAGTDEHPECRAP